MASDHSAFSNSEYATHEVSTPSRVDREPTVAELKQHNAMLLMQLYETTAWFQKENAELQRQVGTLQSALEKSHRELELAVAANAALQAAIYPNTTTPGNH